MPGNTYVDTDGAVWNRGVVVRPCRRRVPKVILHHGSSKMKYTPDRRVSPHFGINSDGEIVQYVQRGIS